MHSSATIQQDIDLIKSIASKMQDPLFVKKSVSDPKNKNPDPFIEMHQWSDLSIASGYPGVLPLFIELDKLYPEERWDLVGHSYILEIIKSINNSGIPSLTLFGGLAGICLYLRQASKNETRYKTLLNKLDDYLLTHIASSHLLPFKESLEKALPIHPRFYETIQGLSGIGMYVLINNNKPEFKKLAHEIIHSFIALTKPIQIKGKMVPGWYVKPDFFFLDSDKQRNPNGNFNLGLSHGIPGVLAFLSIAKMHQVELKGQQEAIETIVHWLVSRLKKTKHDRLFWDTTISFEEEVSWDTTTGYKTKDAWCYGTPGVARSLYLAAKALNDEPLKNFALNAFLSIFTSSQEEWHLLGPTMCHGISGLLMITHLMKKDSGLPSLKEEEEKLRTLLLSYYDPSFAFGFKHAEPLASDTEKAAWIDQADILEGATGVLLTLLSLHTKGYHWHLPFLIDTIE